MEVVWVGWLGDLYVEADEDCVETQFCSNWCSIFNFHGLDTDRINGFRKIRKCGSRSWPSD